MAEESTDPDGARAAWAELSNRHFRYIRFVVARTLGGAQRSGDRTQDAVSDTFQSAFNWARRQPSPAEVVRRFTDVDAETERKRVLGWLAVIARRVVAHSIVDSQESSLELLGELAAPEHEDDPPPSALGELLNGALAKLNENEVEALRVSLPWYDPEKRQFILPRGEAERVAQSLGISAGALRQKRHRTMKRLKALLASEGA